MDWAYPPEDTVGEDHDDLDQNTIDLSFDTGIRGKSNNPASEVRAASSYTSTTTITADPLKMFFDTMYATVAKMPREDILHVRRKVFDVIAEVEEQQHYRQLAKNPPECVDNN